jgi:hypothetical protein
MPNAEPGTGEESRQGGSTAALTTIATVVSPIAVLTALLVYFGWVRTNVQAQALGYDVSLIDMSIQDYILKSVNVLYVPIVLLLFCALGLTSLHRRWIVAGLAHDPGRARVRRLARLLAYSWILWLVVCVLLAVLGAPFAGFAIPVPLTLTLLCVLYGRALDARLGIGEPVSTSVRMLIVALLACTVFWTTERLAREMGEAYAADIAADPTELVAVTVFSPEDLVICVPGVRTETIDRDDSAYRYRYKGLRLLHRSGARYLLIAPGSPSGQHRVIVIRETDTLRLEFTR